MAEQASKDQPARIPFIILQSSQDHRIYLSMEKKNATLKKKKKEKKEGSIIQFPEVSEGENTTLLSCLSQSHIRSDHWQIKALPDTSLPLSGGSRHALGTQNDRVAEEGMGEFFWQERKKDRRSSGGGGKRRKWKHIERKRWNLDTRGPDLQFIWGEDAEEEEEEAEQAETKRWRDTKNSITGLALTLTFIQQGDTPSLSQLLFAAVTGEVCPTF